MSTEKTSKCTHRTRRTNAASISAAASQPQLVQHQATLMMIYLSQLCFQCTGLHLCICSNRQNKHFFMKLGAARSTPFQRIMSKGSHLKMMQITLYPCQQSSKRRRGGGIRRPNADCVAWLKHHILHHQHHCQ